MHLPDNPDDRDLVRFALQTAAQGSARSSAKHLTADDPANALQLAVLSDRLADLASSVPADLSAYRELVDRVVSLQERTACAEANAREWRDAHARIEARVHELEDQESEDLEAARARIVNLETRAAQAEGNAREWERAYVVLGNHMPVSRLDAPTYSQLRDALAEYQRTALTDMATAEVETLAVHLAETVPGLVRPDSSESGPQPVQNTWTPPEEQPEPDPWAPGTDVTDRVKSGDVPHGIYLHTPAHSVDVGRAALVWRRSDMAENTYKARVASGWSLAQGVDYVLDYGRCRVTVATPEELTAAGIEAQA